MATWVVHLRIGEKILKSLDNIDETAYYVGTLAPDSGRMVDAFTYMPPKDVSHWKREGVTFEQRFLDNAEFYKKYIENETDKFKKSLFIGYYVHILTDTLFVREVIHPYINKNGRPVWRENIGKIRAGWYELDYRFVKANKDFKPLQIINSVEKFDNVYFDYFTKDDITERVQYASKLYANCKTDDDIEFLTVTPDGLEKFIEMATNCIVGILKNNHNL
ncbi:MAG: zinc dependent phospholipase C family protein [Clostridia bacterium]|nr:zinc dependent phospholipase C family protein [Clostridia bacterium]